MKTCKKCSVELDESCFYRHKTGAGGLNPWCKKCVLEGVKRYVAGNVELVRLKDRQRGRTSERLVKAAEYRKKNRKRITQSSNEWSKKNRIKKRAHAAVKRALKAGTMTRLPCWCGSNESEAHHPDYSEPLKVVWLCVEHHKAIHRKYKESEHENL